MSKRDLDTYKKIPRMKASAKQTYRYEMYTTETFMFQKRDLHVSKMRLHVSKKRLMYI